MQKISLEKILAERYGDEPDEKTLRKIEYLRQYRKARKEHATENGSQN